MMLSLTLLPVWLLSLALPAHTVLHEQRALQPSSYSPSAAPAHPAAVLPTPLRFFLRQSNLALAEQALLNLSLPSSPAFRHHWTQQQVDAFFRPGEDSARAVEAWLEAAGVPREQVRRSRSGGSVDVFGLSVGTAQELLNTIYSLYTHAASGTQHLAARAYHLPAAVSAHVDFVYPTLQFDARPERQGRRGPAPAVLVPPERRGEEAKWAKTGEKRDRVSLGAPGSGSLPKLGGGVPGPDCLGSEQGISVCGQFIVPQCLEKLYNYPAPNTSCPASTPLRLGIVEYTPQSYLPADLDLFFQYYLPPAQGARPQLQAIDGGYAQSQYTGFGYQGESDLDLQYAMALSWPELPALYQVGDMTGEASFGNFLDALDARFCTYQGGDDAVFDESFPNPSPDGYDHPEDCGTVPKTTVISTSYNYNEQDLTPSYMQRQCTEYLKLGLQGITVVFSSGDYGVAGNTGSCIDPSTGTYDYAGSMFVPSFPSTCPWVLSVGATQTAPGAADPFAQPEVACQDVITSGGGFSNVFPRPAYQEGAVRGYMESYPPDGDMGFNKGDMRAYPDISANGAAYLVAVDGEFQTVYGTSASAPVVASMIAKLNSALASQGNAPIGFINPVLYTPVPGRVNDIVSGSNPGCGTGGFNAAPGWDPVTGMGTPNFESLLQLYTALG